MTRPLTVREKRIAYRLSALVVIASLCAILSFVMYSKATGKVMKQEHVIDSLTRLTDTLVSDGFHLSTMVGRYELTMDHLKEVNPAAAKEAERFLYNETE